MRFKTQEVVRGFQNITYTIDGKEAATKVIFTDVVLREDAGGKGTRTQDRKCVDAEVIRAVEHLPFPLVAELEIEERATKNRAELFVLNIRPIEANKQPPQPKAS